MTMAPSVTPPKPESMDQTTRILEAPVLPTLLRMAAPNVGEAIARVAFIAFDAIFVGWLGTDALAGISLVFPFFITMQLMSASGLGTGVAAAIARALGAGRKTDANVIVGQSLLLAVIIATAFAVLFLTTGPMIYRWLGAEGEALTAATTYSTLVFSGIAAVWLMNILANVVRGTGIMLIPASAIIIGEVVHLSLAPVLILGLGPIPSLGVSGAAIAILASYSVGTLILFVYLIRGRGLVVLRLQFCRPSWRHLREILGVGGAASLNVIQAQLIMIAAIALMASYGQATLAGFGVANRLELLQMPITFALGTAIITMIATNLGAGNNTRVRQIAWTGTAIAFVVGLLFGTVAFFAGTQLMSLFSQEQTVIDAGTLYLDAIGLLLPFVGAGLGLTFAFLGANKPLLPFFAVSVRLLVITAIGWPAVNLLTVSAITTTYILAVAMALFTIIIMIAGYRQWGRS